MVLEISATYFFVILGFFGLFTPYNPHPPPPLTTQKIWFENM